jgi:hypothetical protein
VPVPDTPFPHVNDSEEFAERIIDASLLAIQAARARGLARAEVAAT